MWYLLELLVKRYCWVSYILSLWILEQVLMIGKTIIWLLLILTIWLSILAYYHIFIKVKDELHDESSVSIIQKVKIIIYGVIFMISPIYVKNSKSCVY